MTGGPLRGALLAVLLFAAAPHARGQAASAGAAPPGPPPVLRAERASGPVRVDGRLDEPAWAQAPVAGGFVQRGPRPGEPATEQTEVRFLYDGQAVYVAARMRDREPGRIAAPMARRDEPVKNSDWFVVALDSYHDRRTAFFFAVTPSGLRRDVYQFNDDDADAGWDAVWDVAVVRDSAGWSAEFRIPLSQLRFAASRGGERTWGANFGRYVARRDEWSYWAPLLPTRAGVVSRFGTIEGLSGLRAPRRLEVLPYASTRVDRQPARPGDPFYRPTVTRAAAGVDVKAGLGPHLTLTGTVNPDFGQVELDPAVVNLTAFETRFEERRPFFVEAGDIFQFARSRAYNAYGSPQFFYSRRIGRAPQARVGAEAGAVHVDQPEQTRILAAAHLSGRTAGGWSLGLLDAVTGREHARYADAGGAVHAAAVEPLSNYLVARVRRDLNRGGSFVGGMATATHRQLDARLAPLLRRDAYVGGIDFEHAWARRTWTLSGNVAASTVGGSANAIELTQRSSAHYFQRPDATHVRLDPARTRLWGHTATLAVQRTGDWDMSVQLRQVSPGFEMNDLGYAQRADGRTLATFLGRRITRPVGRFRQHTFTAFTTHAWNTAGDAIFANLGAGAWAMLHGGWSGGVDVSVQPATRDDRLTRGGPLGARPAGWRTNLHLNSDSRRPFSFTAGLYVAGDRAGGRTRTAGTTLSYRPGPPLRMSIAPSVQRTRDPGQYLFDFADPAAAATYGRRYVFGRLEQTTFSMATRVDWTFAPTLSLQLYAQPFVSASDFRGFREFTTPGRAEYADYGGDRGTVCAYDRAFALSPTESIPCPATRAQAQSDPRLRVVDDPDATLRSLRGNAVLRWEYRPGSVLFLVWQQERQGMEGLGELDAGRDLGRLLGAPARNVFTVKATYWIG